MQVQAGKEEKGTYIGRKERKSAGTSWGKRKDTDRGQYYLAPVSTILQNLPKNYCNTTG